MLSESSHKSAPYNQLGGEVIKTLFIIILLDVGTKVVIETLQLSTEPGIQEDNMRLQARCRELTLRLERHDVPDSQSYRRLDQVRYDRNE